MAVLMRCRIEGEYDKKMLFKSHFSDISISQIKGISVTFDCYLSALSKGTELSAYDRVCNSMPTDEEKL